MLPAGHAILMPWACWQDLSHHGLSPNIEPIQQHKCLNKHKITKFQFKQNQMAFHINFLSNQTEMKHTWLSQEVATRKLALGLKLRLETESFGGWPTYEKFNHSKPNLWQSQRKHWDLQRQYLLTSNELFGLGFGLDTKKFDIEEASQVKWGTTCERERERKSHKFSSLLLCLEGKGDRERVRVENE